jgi:hypothetical protein
MITRSLFRANGLLPQCRKRTHPTNGRRSPLEDLKLELEIRDGFELLQKQFALSIAQIEELDSRGRDEAVICDLFVNYKLRISDVANLAHTSQEAVIRTLLKRGIVKNRRTKDRLPTDGIGLRRPQAR